MSTSKCEMNYVHHRTDNGPATGIMVSLYATVYLKYLLIGYSPMERK